MQTRKCLSGRRFHVALSQLTIQSRHSALIRLYRMDFYPIADRSILKVRDAVYKDDTKFTLIMD